MRLRPRPEGQLTPSTSNLSRSLACRQRFRRDQSGLRSSSLQCGCSCRAMAVAVLCAILFLASTPCFAPVHAQDTPNPAFPQTTAHLERYVEVEASATCGDAAHPIDYCHLASNPLRCSDTRLCNNGCPNTEEAADLTPLLSLAGLDVRVQTTRRLYTRISPSLGLVRVRVCAFVHAHLPCSCFVISRIRLTTFHSLAQAHLCCYRYHY